MWNTCIFLVGSSGWILCYFNFTFDECWRKMKEKKNRSKWKHHTDTASRECMSWNFKCTLAEILFEIISCDVLVLNTKFPNIHCHWASYFVFNSTKSIKYTVYFLLSNCSHFAVVEFYDPEQRHRKEYTIETKTKGAWNQLKLNFILLFVCKM